MKDRACLSIIKDELDRGDDNGEEDYIETPTMKQLQKVALAASLPFIGFGILDNCLMIICGEWIDTTLCVSMGFTTMAAAALGNTISDAGGVFSGGIVEDLAAQWGVKAPRLTRAQEELAVTRNYERLGQLFGVVLGCLIGMFPLLFIDARKAERLKRERALDEMYQTVLEGVAEMLDADAAMLMLVDEEENQLFTRARENIPEFRCHIEEGIKGAVATTGNFINAEDVRETPYFSAKRHINYQGTGLTVVSVLCMPIIGPDDRVFGVVEVINKGGASMFSEKDEDVLSAICSHISTSISSVDGSERAFTQTMKLCERSLKNTGHRLNSAQNTRMDFLFRLVLEEVTSALHAEAAQLLIVDRPSKTLYTRVSENLPESRCPLNEGIMGQVVSTAEALNIHNIRESSYFDNNRHSDYMGTGIAVDNVLCHPITDGSGNVIAIIEAINKKGGTFNSSDMAFVNAVASHLALNMQGPGTSLKSILRMMAHHQQGTARHDEAAIKQLLSSAFDEVDVNGDGVISKEEFEAAAKRLLSGERVGMHHARTPPDKII